MRGPQYRPKSRGQAMVGIFDFGRAIAVYINIAEAAHEGARQLVLRSNYASTPPDSVIINATLAKIGGGGMVLMEDPCLSNPTPCTSPSFTGMAPNTGYIWISPNRTTGNSQVTVRVTYLFTPMTGMFSELTGAGFVMTAGSSMRAEY